MAPNWKPNRVTASVYLFLCAAGMLAAGIMSIAGDKVSALRISLLGVALLFCGGFCILALRNLKDDRLAHWWLRFTSGRFHSILIVISAILFLAGWITIWTPLERFGSAYYYVLGILPFIICGSANDFCNPENAFRNNESHSQLP